MATGDLHTKFRADRTSGSRDILTDTQRDRHTDRQMGGSQYSAPLPGRSNKHTKLLVDYK